MQTACLDVLRLQRQKLEANKFIEVYNENKSK